MVAVATAERGGRTAGRGGEVNFGEAKKLILEEGNGTTGIVAAARRGDGLPKARVDGIIHAIDVYYGITRKEREIDKKMASALFNLAYHVGYHVHSWISRGSIYRKDLVDSEIPRLVSAVESVFNRMRVEAD
jgi:hypothetical protein